MISQAFGAGQQGDAVTDPALEREIARWLAYLEALDAAGQAMDRARRLVPDHGLDHGVERIRVMLDAGIERLERLQELQTRSQTESA